MAICSPLAVDFLPTLVDLGARGIKIQLYILDGLPFASFMILMRGRFAFRCSSDTAFADKQDRVLHWVHEWVLGANCKSHVCSNAVVWSLKRFSTKALQDNCHIAIKSLLNTSEGLRGKIQEFIRSRVAGLAKDDLAEEVESFW